MNDRRHRENDGLETGIMGGCGRDINVVAGSVAVRRKAALRGRDRRDDADPLRRKRKNSVSPLLQPVERALAAGRRSSQRVPPATADERACAGRTAL